MKYVAGLCLSVFTWTCAIALFAGIMYLLPAVLLLVGLPLICYVIVVQVAKGIVALDAALNKWVARRR